MKPKIDYSIHVHEPDELGNVSVTFSVPGGLLYGPDINKLLLDAPAAVAKLRELNSRNREQVQP